MAITEIASLATVKQYLRIPVANTTDDAVLTAVFIPAAQVVIERELGYIVAKTITAERHNGGKPAIYLRELPVLYVSNVEEGWGYYAQELDDQEVNQAAALSMWAYSLDNAKEGVVTRRAPGNVNVPFVLGVNNIRVDYVVGRAQMPFNAVLAFCELLAHWYRTSQLRTNNQVSTAFNPSAVNSDFTRAEGVTSVNLGVPTAIIELLKPNRRRPIIG